MARPNYRIRYLDVAQSCRFYALTYQVSDAYLVASLPCCPWLCPSPSRQPRLPKFDPLTAPL